jgi:DNA invertase Pin-like site-specific DNA recombinase
MRKGVSYFRVSTNQQGESKLRLEAQQQIVYQFAKVTGTELIQEFTEIESGKKNKRPLLQRALAYCKKHDATLIIAKLDRLGRSVAFGSVSK